MNRPGYRRQQSDATAAHAPASAMWVGLVGGPIIGLALVAQQYAASVERWLLGALLVAVGLSFVGLFVARETQVESRAAAARAGAAAGLVAGLIAALTVIALLLAMSINGEFALYAENALRQLDPSGALEPLRRSGQTLAELARLGVAIQLACYGAGLPLAGLVFGGGGAWITYSTNPV